MTYKLFIDDERYPSGNIDEWVITRSSEETIRIVSEKGMPNFISFDHDLGGEDTSIQFIKWLENKLLDEELKFPVDFDFYVHSQNPIGAKNIRLWMVSLVTNFKE